MSLAETSTHLDAPKLAEWVIEHYGITPGQYDRLSTEARLLHRWRTESKTADLYAADTRFDALTREAQVIREQDPPFNQQLRDPKPEPGFVTETNESPAGGTER